MSDYTYTSFNVTVKGLRPIIKKYENLIRGVEVDSEKGLRDLVPYVKGLIRANFESEGRRRGGQWAHLKPDTIKRKMQLVAYGAGAERIIRGTPFGGGFITFSGGRITGAFKPTKKGQAKHIWEPVRLTDRLFDAATGTTSDSYILVTPKDLVVGVQNIPYARLQRFGGHNNVPSRDYLYMTELDKINLMREFEDWVYGQYVGIIGFEGMPGVGRRKRGYGGYVY